MSADNLRHLEEHEKRAKLSAAERAALRHKHGFLGVHYTDEKMLMTDEKFEQLRADVLAHSVAQQPHASTIRKPHPVLRAVKE